MVKSENEQAANNIVDAWQADAAKTNLSELKGNRNASYSIHVFFEDLRNIKYDRSSESCIEHTVVRRGTEEQLRQAVSRVGLISMANAYELHS